jgi:hypothetical protein
MEYAKVCMSMRLGNARYSADPVDVGAQSDLFGATAPAIASPPVAVQIGGYGTPKADCAGPHQSRCVTDLASAASPP